MEITLFSGWHFMYIAVIIGISLLIAILLRGKTEKTKQIVLAVLAIAVTCTYILDLFLMPLVREDHLIDIDKLPFHFCTILAVFVPFAQFNKKFAKIKDVIACFAIVSSLMYITYPGSALGGVEVFSYKVMQTFAYHGVLFAWGFLSVTTGSAVLSFKTIWKNIVGLVILIAWGLIGSYTYSALTPHHYDWFFVTGSTYPFIPAWAMPFVVLGAVFAMCAIIYLIDWCVKLCFKKAKAKKEASKAE